MPAGVVQSRHALLGTQLNRGKDGQILVKEAEKASEMPAKHCLRRTCSSDSRFPSFMKASVLCRSPNQRESLKHAFAGAKPAGVPTASPMSEEKKYIYITRSGRNFAHERSV